MQKKISKEYFTPKYGNINQEFYKGYYMTWKEEELKGMHKSYYCKTDHRCYTCEHFYKSYEAWTCQKMTPDNFISLSNYNLKVDDVMNIFEKKCPLSKGAEMIIPEEEDNESLYGMYKDMKELKQQSHQKNFLTNVEVLEESGLKYKFSNDTCILFREKIKVDFYPHTGRWKYLNIMYRGGAESFIRWYEKELKKK